MTARRNIPVLPAHLLSHADNPLQMSRASNIWSLHLATMWRLLVGISPSQCDGGRTMRAAPAIVCAASTSAFACRKPAVQTFQHPSH